MSSVRKSNLLFITSTKGGYIFAGVDLTACLIVSKIAYEQTLMKFSGNVDKWDEELMINFYCRCGLVLDVVAVGGEMTLFILPLYHIIS